MSCSKLFLLLVFVKSHCGNDELCCTVTDGQTRYIGGNMLLKNENAKALGWKPKGPKFFETLERTD